MVYSDEARKVVIGSLLGKKRRKGAERTGTERTGTEEVGQGTLKIKKRVVKQRSLAGVIAKRRLQERKQIKDIQKDIDKY